MKIQKRVPKESTWYRDWFDQNFITTSADFTCPQCGKEVLLVRHPERPNTRGVYCDCAQWVGHKDRVPLTPQRWMTIIKLNLPHYPIL